jgi:hypothetical protein
LSDAPDTRLREQIDAARAELARLERLATVAPCAAKGHDWRHIGGMNCCCSPDGRCSVPVYECAWCGDCDYGENDEAAEKRRNCAEEGTWL